MSMSEFVSRFAAKNDKNQLFETLRRVGQLDRLALLAIAGDSGWQEWPPLDDPGSSGIGMGMARA
jgi:hypothetical protein